MRTKKFIAGSLLAAGLAASIYGCIEPDAVPETAYSEWLSGGSQTVFNSGAGAFSAAFPNLTSARARVHEIGDGAFGQTFVSAPAPVNPGLGPVFNNVSCTSCHVNDGRGKPPLPGEQISSLLIRLSLPGNTEHGGPVPVPGFGNQLQQRAVFGAQPEALVRIDYEEKSFQFADGTPYSLRQPTYTLYNSYIPLPANVLISPRIAPPVFGLGLLEAIDEGEILSRADEHDTDHDGISGKPNYVWDLVKNKKILGRFGWKANNPSLLQQSAGAYNEDMGITNFVFPQESSYQQEQDPGSVASYEVSDSLLYSVEFYIRSLGVPARRNADNTIVLQGKNLFEAARCSSCHTPRLHTKTDVSFPEISSQVIYPYTDLLVHDMGNDLADNRPDFEAGGKEWRTAPLWGIGLTQVVNGHQNFLHDGRARTLLEAVMWHGGEAEASREYVRNLTKQERDALLRFLESL